MEVKAVKPISEKHGTGILKFTVSTSIKATLQEVWENVVKAENIRQYFTVDAIGDLDKIGYVTWYWTSGADLIRVLEVEEKKRIKFEWNGNNVDYKITCEFKFEEKDGKTIVRINEWGWENNEKGIQSSYANCSGWTEYLDTLKVFILYKIPFLKA